MSERPRQLIELDENVEHFGEEEGRNLVKHDRGLWYQSKYRVKPLRILFVESVGRLFTDLDSCFGDFLLRSGKIRRLIEEIWNSSF